MKIAVTADWHIHNFTEFSLIKDYIWNEEVLRFEEIDNSNKEYENSKELNTRLINILNGICDIRDYCVDNGIEYTLMGGDCFHKRGTIDVVTYNCAYKVIKSFKDKGIKLIMLAGNHDDVDSSKIPLTSVHSFQDIAHIVEKPEFIELNGFNVLALPYSRDKKFIINSIEDYINSSPNAKETILLAHLGITGGVVGSGLYSMNDEYTLKDIYSDKFKYTVLGHYHRPQLLSKTALYPGTPVQNTFNDEIVPDSLNSGYNGFFVLDLYKRGIDFIPIIAPRFITLYEGWKSLYTIEDLKGNYVRIKSIEPDTQEEQFEELDNLRLETPKEYVKEHRSNIDISNSFEESVKIYAVENLIDGLNLDIVINKGLEILKKAELEG